MKKGWKIFWIVCASVAGLGLVLAIAGAVMGATFGSVQAALWDSGHRVEQTVEQSVERIDPIDDEFDEDDYVDDDFTDDVDLEERFANASVITNGSTCSLEGIQQLDVDLSHLKVVLQESTGTELEFETSNIPSRAAGELVMLKEGNELEIQIRDENNWKPIMRGLGNTPAPTLTMKIPKGKLTQMSFSIGGGVLEAEQLHVGELEVEVGAGVVDLQNLQANTAELKVGAGEVNLAGTISGEASIDCGIGKVDMQLSGTQQDYSYSMECGAGVIRIGNEEYSGIIKERTIMGGNVMIEVECGAGEVTIGFSGV